MSDWTIEALKVHIDTGLGHIEMLLQEQDRRYEQSFQALRETQRATTDRAELALQKAESSLDRRLAEVNEFRGSLNDVVSTMMPRAEVTALLKGLGEKVDELKARLDGIQGTSRGLAAGWAWLVGAVGVVATIVALWLSVGG